MKIILDTNIIVADYYLKSPHFSIMYSFIEKGGAELCIPKLVISELENKYNEQLSSSIQKLEESQKELKRFGVIQENPSIDVGSQSSNYILDTLKTLKSFKTRYLDYPNISHESISKRAIEKQKPFKSNGDGYRDTLIWENILAELKDGSEIVFISANTKDFYGSSGGLHEDLKRELEQIGVSETKLKLFLSLKEFVDSVISPQLKRLKEVEKQLTEGKYAPLVLEKFLEEKDGDIMDAINEELVELLKEPRFDEPSVEGLYAPHQIDSIDVHIYDDNSLFIEFDANFEVDVQFFVDKWDYGVMDEEDYDFHVTDREWNEWVVQAEKNIEVTLSISLIFNSESKTVDNFEITGIERVWKD